jgi:hypothetical protein
MSEPLPDPNQFGAPYTPSNVEIPGPLFKRVWLALMAVVIVVAAVVIAFQVFG